MCDLTREETEECIRRLSKFPNKNDKFCNPYLKYSNSDVDSIEESI